jgi:hypothetical protein
LLDLSRDGEREHDDEDDGDAELDAQRPEEGDAPATWC